MLSKVEFYKEGVVTGGLKVDNSKDGTAIKITTPDNRVIVIRENFFMREGSKTVSYFTIKGMFSIKSFSEDENTIQLKLK